MKQIVLLAVTICALFFLSCNQATNPENGTGPGGTGNKTPFLGKWQSDFTMYGQNEDPIHCHADISFDSLGRYEFIMTVPKQNIMVRRKGTFTYDATKIYCTVTENNISNDTPVEFDYSLNNNVLHLDSGFSKGDYTRLPN